MSFSLDNKLVVIDSFQFLSSSLDSLIKNLGKNDIKNLSQKFDSEVVDFVKQKDFITMNICVISKSLVKHCRAKMSLIVD